VQGLVFSGLNPTCQVSSKSIQVSKFPRFISENDLPDRYNNRRSDRYRIADNNEEEEEKEETMSVQLPSVPGVDGKLGLTMG